LRFEDAKNSLRVGEHHFRSFRDAGVGFGVADAYALRIFGLESVSVGSGHHGRRPLPRRASPTTTDAAARARALRFTSRAYLTTGRARVRLNLELAENRLRLHPKLKDLLDAGDDADDGRDARRDERERHVTGGGVRRHARSAAKGVLGRMDA
jgi:hypothetical protein